MHSLSIRSKLYPPRDIRILSNVQSHTSLPPSGMEGHSWTAYFVKGVYSFIHNIIIIIIIIIIIWCLDSGLATPSRLSKP